MIPDWQANCIYVSSLLPRRHSGVWRGLNAALTGAGITVRQLKKTADIWVKDFLPIQTHPGRFIKFCYHPDYLIGHEHLITGDDACELIPQLRRCQRLEINLDGGNVVAGKSKVILTNKVFAENRDYPPRALRRKLEGLFEATCIIIPREPFDPIGHADGLVRFLDDSTVAVNDYSRIDRSYGRRLREVLLKHRLQCEEVPYLLGDKGTDGMPTAVGLYVNYLRTAGLVVVPTFGMKDDDRALRRLEQLFPGTTIVAIRCEGLAAEGGCLSCCTWGLQTKRATPKGLPC